MTAVTTVENPCRQCGACCAHYRVSFYWAESDAGQAEGMPLAMTVPVHAHLVAMRGTEQRPVRCVALEGVVGEQVSCRHYAARPSPCREVVPWDAHGQPDAKCNAARAAHGLPQLTSRTTQHA